jgi:hypothetical protein
MTTHSVTFSRDNLVQLVLRSDFYEKNPDLEPLRDELNQCVEKFRESGRKAGCGCRADAKLLFGCLGHLLETVNAWKETAPEKLTNFVTYATKITPAENERVVLGIFFRTTGGDSEVTRYEFTCP